MALAGAWQAAALGRMAEVDAGCVHSIQPSFNNEYETKYTQERDCFQDYSPGALASYRKHLAALNPDLAFWNARWAPDGAADGAFASWEAVQPPAMYQHGKHRDDGARSARYWDWQAWRHAALHDAHERACARAAARGFRCILHFGEFLTSNDAIYAGGAIFSLAASPWVDFVVVDSNFLTAAHNLNDVRIVQLLLAAMKPFGKPVFFEGAFERFKDGAMHKRAVELTVSSGAHGVGFTNWLGRVEEGSFFSTVLGPAGVGPAAGGRHAAAEAAMAGVLGGDGAYLAHMGSPRALRLGGGGGGGSSGNSGSGSGGGASSSSAVAAAPVPAGAANGGAPRVAILAPHRSFQAFKGLAVGPDGKLVDDALQEELFRCLDAVEAATTSTNNLGLFAVPPMILPALDGLDEVWYLEPEVLLSSDAAAVAAARARAALAGVPVHVCGGAARAGPPHVVQECCGGV
ncbi:hypothetical protein MNEG_15257 [Monoraphidium neglectum]|uniref:Glycoside hydrolase family 42 N-terminal domain-containing protein n=1 Tax=Monoraphidium neglectum TaxID=145388 RepID=A0A0D2IXS1_9CHLO|nr:hypothetical protein MNEG_15257 [Monoraphidium neglectum]KIY92707.1 hypothetical protein MNEG_15257 [Monoraphidium neglectum]|eukprot:XP_013891727.1 hypothetical protein MNEG_15257 [Monoraphidium neglectum]